MKGPLSDGAHLHPADAPFFAERLVGQAISGGEKAKHFQTAIEALRRALVPNMSRSTKRKTPCLIPGRVNTADPTVITPAAFIAGTAKFRYLHYSPCHSGSSELFVTPA